MAENIVLYDKDGTVAYKSEDNPKIITIGREENRDFKIERDSWASREHCLIEKVNKNYAIQDCNSKHGTLVNGKLINSCVLMPGDIITIGLNKYRFEIECTQDS